jgi:hypothetical protein
MIHSNQDGRLRVLSEIESCKEKITVALSKHTNQLGTDAARLCSFLHVLRIFEIEFLAEVKEWARIAQLIAVLLPSSPKFILDALQQTFGSDTSTLDTFEAIVDILVCTSYFASLVDSFIVSVGAVKLSS